MENNRLLDRLFQTLISIAVLVGGWFSNQIWEGQKQLAVRLNAMDVDRATITASRFTAMDWVAAKSVIDTQLGINDRRIFKLETALESQSKALERIEGKLGTKLP